jgi:hypothetical protein
MRSDEQAFSSQVESLGGSENAIRRASIFKPSGITWRLGKCDQTSKYFQAKWKTWRLGKCDQTSKYFQAKWNHSQTYRRFLAVKGEPALSSAVA